MRYFFESSVEKKENDYVIQIPFNVWEVCKQRDIIQGDVVLDNRHVDCELLPKEKGNYEIHIEEKDGENLELGVPHKILTISPSPLSAWIRAAITVLTTPSAGSTA